MMRVIFLIVCICLDFTTAIPNHQSHTGVSVRVSVLDANHRELAVKTIPHYLTGTQRNIIQGQITIVDDARRTPYDTDRFHNALFTGAMAPSFCIMQGGHLCEQSTTAICRNPCAICCCLPCIALTCATGAVCCAVGATTAVITIPTCAAVGCGQVACSREMVNQGQMNAQNQLQLEEGPVSVDHHVDQNLVFGSSTVFYFKINLDFQGDARADRVPLTLKKLQLDLSPEYYRKSIKWSYKAVDASRYTAIRSNSIELGESGPMEFILRASAEVIPVSRLWRHWKKKPNYFAKIQYELTTASPESDYKFMASDEQMGSLHPDFVRDSLFLQPMFSQNWNENSEPLMFEDPYWYEFLSLCYHHPPTAAAEVEHMTDNQLRNLYRVAHGNGPDVLNRVEPLFNMKERGRKIWAEMKNQYEHVTDAD